MDCSPKLCATPSRPLMSVPPPTDDNAPGLHPNLLHELLSGRAAHAQRASGANAPVFGGVVGGPTRGVVDVAMRSSGDSLVQGFWSPPPSSNGSLDGLLADLCGPKPTCLAMDVACGPIYVAGLPDIVPRPQSLGGEVGNDVDGVLAAAQPYASLVAGAYTFGAHAANLKTGFWSLLFGVNPATSDAAPEAQCLDEEGAHRSGQACWSRQADDERCGMDDVFAVAPRPPVAAAAVPAVAAIKPKTRVKKADVGNAAARRKRAPAHSALAASTAPSKRSRGETAQTKPEAGARSVRKRGCTRPAVGAVSRQATAAELQEAHAEASRDFKPADELKDGELDAWLIEHQLGAGGLDFKGQLVASALYQLCQDEANRLRKRHESGWSDEVHKLHGIACQRARALSGKH